MKHLKGGFTLIEILLGIAIVSMVIVSAFQALTQVATSRTKLVERSEIYKDAFYATELLFTKIKSGGIIDYEEYFNRSKIGVSTDPNTGLYNSQSQYGNTNVAFSKCMRLPKPPTLNPGCAPFGQQRYGNYTYQFIDYDIDGDGILPGDDGDGNIFDDDEYLGRGPDAIGTNKVNELYLIDGLGKKRTYFRWNIKQDLNKLPSVGPCNTSTVKENCIGNLQYITLEGKDWGMDHNSSIDDSTQYDGVIDTWIVSPEFTGGDIKIANSSSNVEPYWVNLFPETMSVTDVEFEIYPKKDLKLSWNNSSNDPENISPYVRVKLKIQPSWIVRKFIATQGKIPELELNSTINLNGEYFVNE